MSFDLKNDYSQIKNKLAAYQLVNENKKNEEIIKKSRDGDNQEQDTRKIGQGIEELTDNVKKTTKQVKNQFEELIDIFKYTIPKPESGSYDSTLVRLFLLALSNTKERLLQIIFEETITALGCSQEQEFEPGVPIYIKVETIDLFNILKEDPNDSPMSFFYEKTEVSNGTLPFSMNRSLKSRFGEEGVPFSTDNGGKYIGASGSEIFDFEYVTQDDKGNQGDFYKVTLTKEIDGAKRISDFLLDYYQSIDILEFDVVISSVMNSMMGWLDTSIGTDSDKQNDFGYFSKILTRILGLCFDETQEIDVSGTAKIGELDLVDQSFFELSPLDLRNIEVEVDNIRKGVVEFEDCGNVKLPVDTIGTQTMLRKLQDENSIERKIGIVESMLDNTANNKEWESATLPGLNFNASVKMDFIKKIPSSIVKSILSPKMLFGLITLSKSLKLSNIDNIDSLQSFVLVFKRFIVNITSKVASIFIEELFEIIKKNISQLVEDILKTIALETKNKQIRIIASIIYALYLLGSLIVDFRKCKSVVDELLKLLNLGLSFIGGPQIPLPILAAADLLPGVSDTRAFSNVLEQLQKSGLPTGDLPDGSPNLMNIAMFGLIKGQNQEVSENGKVNVFIPPITITPAGVTVPTKAWGKQL